MTCGYALISSLWLRAATLAACWRQLREVFFLLIFLKQDQVVGEEKYLKVGSLLPASMPWDRSVHFVTLLH